MVSPFAPYPQYSGLGLFAVPHIQEILDLCLSCFLATFPGVDVMVVQALNFPAPLPIAPAKETAVKEDCLDRVHRLLGNQG
ncbi:hypothetical protein QUA00_31130 [Microcoleus sp. T2B6]